LNDPTYVEAARAFAELVLRHEGDDRSKLNYAYQRALSRPISDVEATVLMPLLHAQLQQYKEQPLAAKELLSVGARPLPVDIDTATLAAWTAVARVLLNLHESIARY
jgi:hypothetical protein